MRLLSFFLMLIFVSSSLAQATLQNNNWMVGGTNVGFGIPPTPGPSLNFSNCTPTVLNNAPGAQFEGQTAISDPNTGALLFYSSGSQVRNALGQVMTNGNLVATSNSISQNLIVKKPGSSTLYYLFTPETQAGAIVSTTNPGINGFSYSIIDMSLAGGLGAVVSNGNLLQPFQNCEMVTGVYHQNGQDIWIIGHKFGSNTFFAYLLTSAGVNTTPVYSSVGPTIITPGSNNYANSNYDAVGELKASPNGQKLAFTTFYNGYTCLFDFNKTNGAITNPIPLNLGSAGYGVSFSPDNTKLYFSRVDPSQGGVSFLNNGSIVQFDITSNSQATIQASMYVVYSSPTGFRSLKLGPNGKLYAARTTLTAGGNGSSYLAVINNPNLAGAACNFVNDGVFIGLNRGRWGLNNVIEDSYTCGNFNFTLGPDINKCPGTTITISAPSNQAIYQWNTTSNSQSITVTQPGTYWVTVSGPNGTGSDTIVVNDFAAPTLTINGDAYICPNSNTELMASPNFVSYVWNSGQQLQNIVVGPGSYIVTATDVNGCNATDTFVINAWPNPQIEIIGDTSVCLGSTTVLTASSNFTNYLWNNGSPTQNNLVSSGIYWVTATDTNGCEAIDTITVTELPLPAIILLGTNFVCTGQQTPFEANAGFDTYIWSNGANSPNTNLGSGLNTLTVIDSAGCQATDSVFIYETAPIANISTQNSSTIYSDPIQLLSNTVAGLFPVSSWYWNFGDGNTSNLENPVHQYQQSGVYNIELIVTDELGCTDTTSYQIQFDAEFVYYIPNTFTPDGNEINQIFLPIFSNSINPENYRLSIYNRWGEVIFESLNPANGWDGSYGNDKKPCQPGIYTYVVSYRIPNENQSRTISGHVNLIR